MRAHQLDVLVGQQASVLDRVDALLDANRDPGTAVRVDGDTPTDAVRLLDDGAHLFAPVVAVEHARSGAGDTAGHEELDVVGSAAKGSADGEAHALLAIRRAQWCRWGTVYLYVEGDPVDPSEAKAQVPAHRKQTYTVFHEVVLRPGEQYTIMPNTLHWFQGGDEGAVVSEFSTRRRDETDVFTDPEIDRTPLD